MKHFHDKATLFPAGSGTQEEGRPWEGPTVPSAPQTAELGQFTEQCRRGGCLQAGIDQPLLELTALEDVGSRSFQRRFKHK